MKAQPTEPLEYVQTSWLPAASLLDWLPDETLYSILSRQHRLSGNLRPETTRGQFFGHRLRGSHHDFPTHLDYLVDRTLGAWGDAASIIDRHTILPYYLHLRSEITRAAVIGMARTADLAQVKTWLGLLERRFNQFHPLKACSKCMAADLEDHGVAYWHRQHELPAVWWCVAHDLPLGAAVAKAPQSFQSTWQLPDDCALVMSQSAL